jgi:tetratricopeptide (TPR) repeat protein
MQVTIDQALHIAASHEQAGRLAEAESVLRHIVASVPQHAEALDRLSLLAVRLGRGDAPALCLALVQMLPENADAANRLGTALAAQGQMEKAAAAFARAVAMRPGEPAFHSNLGAARQAMGDPTGAETSFAQAIALDGNHGDAHVNLCRLFLDRGQIDQALAAGQNAVRAKPQSSEAHYNCAVAMQSAGRPDLAAAEYAEALKLNPRLAQAAINLAALLDSTGQFEQAIALGNRAVELRPDIPEAHYNLGRALAGAGQHERAIECFGRAVELRATFAAAYNNLAYSRRALGQYDKALGPCQMALALDPNDPAIHNNMCHLRLVRGEFAEGWREYEWRWKVAEFRSPARDLSTPRWQGQPPEHPGRSTLLLHPEQGFGDTIQFLRLIDQARALAGWRVVLECQSPLYRLLSSSRLADETIEYRGPGDPDVDFDVHLPLGSLPLATGCIDPRNFPVPFAPYIAADPELAATWRPLLGDGPELRVGLVWAGSPSHAEDQYRSIPLSKLSSLARPGVRFFSLQLGAAAKQISDVAHGLDLVDASPSIHDFADTAALIDRLDLLITVDTAAAHLAGAMGKPVWILLAHVPDWRWMLDRSDSPWYPTARLFRQSRGGQWSDPVDAIARSLDELLARRAGRVGQADHASCSLQG